MTYASARLPEGYHESSHIDLQKDKKLAFFLNAAAILIFIPIFCLGLFLSPFSQFLDGGLLMLALLMLGNLLYMILHELVHGIFMRIFSGVRPHYGFTGLYAYAGSEVYFDRLHYLIIAMAPVVIWGIVLAVLCILTHKTRWFWLFYILEALNLCGAAGDFYVTWHFSRMPADILVQDTGVSMTVYTK